MIGGGAYAAGRARAQGQTREQSQDERLAALEAEQAPPMPIPPSTPAAGGTDVASKLTQLKGLLDQGLLTTDEFETAKQKLLAG